MDISTAILVSVLGACCSTDVTAFGQFMISRPIVCAPLIGAVLGDLQSGLWIGMIVELIWVSAIPMGAAVPTEDSTSIAVMAAIWALSAAAGTPAAMVLALALAVPAGALYKQLDMALRFFNVRIVHWVEAGIAAGNESRISIGIYSGLALFFLKAFVFYMVLIYPGLWLIDTASSLLPAKILSGLSLAWRVLPLIGFGLFIVNFKYDKFPCPR